MDAIGKYLLTYLSVQRSHVSALHRYRKTTQTMTQCRSSLVDNINLCNHMRFIRVQYQLNIFLLVYLTLMRFVSLHVKKWSIWEWHNEFTTGSILLGPCAISIIAVIEPHVRLDSYHPHGDWFSIVLQLDTGRFYKLFSSFIHQPIHTIALMPMK